MVTALKWVKDKKGHLESLRHLYVADWVTFKHVLKGLNTVSEDAMRSRGTSATGTAGGMADAFVLQNADSQVKLENIYTRAMSSRQAVCTTFAGAAAYILSAPGGPKVEVIAHNAKKQHSGTHLFVAVGRDDVDVTDPSWIKDSCIIVDCWAQALGAPSCYIEATRFNTSPIRTETHKLTLVKNTSAFATAVPTLNGPSATGKKGCFVTSATCLALGMGDDCEPLQVVRSVRDLYLVTDPEGVRLVAAYYEMAPPFVDEIDRQPDREALYRDIYELAVAPAVAAARVGDTEAAAMIFRRWMDGLCSGLGPREMIENARLRSG